MQPMSKVSLLIVGLGIILIPISGPLSVALFGISVLCSGYAALAPEIVRRLQRRALARALEPKFVLNLTPSRAMPIEDQRHASRLVTMLRTNTLWSLYSIKPEVLDWCEANLVGGYGAVPMDFMDVVEFKGVRMWFDQAGDADRFRARWLEPAS